jgi:putative colanic acid polymerase
VSIVFILVFLHFQIFVVNGVPITIGLLGVVPMFFILFKVRINRTFLIVAVGLALLPWVNMFSVYFDGIEFLRTWLQWTFFVIVMAIASSSIPRTRRLGSKFQLAYMLVTSYLIIQKIFYELGNAFLVNPWRENQYLYQYRLPFSGETFRSPGFYLEPSFAGVVVMALAVVLMRLNLWNRTSLFLLVGTLISTRSLNFILFCVLLLFLYYRPSRTLAKHKGSLVLLTLSLFAVLIPYLLSRWDSIGVSGTSANYRIIGPLRFVGYTLENYLFGVPMGSLDQIMPVFGQVKGSTVGSSVDNGIYVLILYFGWLAVLGLLLLVANIWRLMKSSDLGLEFILFLAALFASGGFFAPEVVALLLPVIYANKLSRERND